jgi:hypothetical protein
MLMWPQIPESLRIEHEALHSELVQATMLPGTVGEEARAVAQALHAHFEKEEEYALPPLGLLTALAHGEVTPRMTEVVAMTDRLEADLPHMLQEHQAIVAALEKLISAATAANEQAVLRFADKLKLHARMEEEVSYPTSILIGRYLKVKLGR